MKANIILTIAASVLLWFAVQVGQAQTQSKDTQFFETKIRPLLIQHCHQCHSNDKKAEGGLRLDTKSGWQLGGESGPAIVAGAVDKSILIQRVQSDDSDSIMPPKNSGMPLNAAQIADLVSWVQNGAFDPREDSSPHSTTKDWESLFRERMNWWSLRPVSSVTPPDSNDPNWSRTAVDRFLRRAMEKQDIVPSPLASPEVLLRRASLVLTGLPPSPSLVEQFSRLGVSELPHAYEQVIETLLNSPQYGERFARHWLDVVRFSETHGNEWNYDVPYAWRYRDYAIRAFNADVPYDRFVREHIAGDLLNTKRVIAGVGHDESPIGTAIFRFGEVNHDSCTQFPVIGFDILDNQLDTITKAFQATTAACARCHDHKLDAISQRDYYSLLAILRSSRPIMRTLDDLSSQAGEAQKLFRLKEQIRKQLTAIWVKEVKSIDSTRLNSVLLPKADQTDKPTNSEKPRADKPLPLENPAHLWSKLSQAEPAEIDVVWAKFVDTIATESLAREEFNSSKFVPLADFRQSIPADWSIDGHGLQHGVTNAGELVIAPEGDWAIKSVLPASLVTFRASEKQNGSMRSPSLQRTHGKVSFEVIGGRFSLARLVFNNCQFNYDRQHSIHHDDWAWITIDWPDKTDTLNPFIELATFWDNPKFPDPLGTLGKDVEVQREPFDVHAKNPRSWWGIRRIVLHDGAETPKASLTHLKKLLDSGTPRTLDQAADCFVKIAREAVDRFDQGTNNEDDVIWLNWFIRSGILSNKSSASPDLEKLIADYRAVESSLPTPTTFPTMADEGLPIDQAIFARGDQQKPRNLVARGYLRMLEPEGLKIAPLSSGRCELAEAIASPNNPLTARVMVNRVWLWVFGRGLVGTPDDFGHLGDAPLHPELLDYLASQFVADGWSVKKLVRLMVMSQAFRTSASPTASANKLDPGNHSFSHYSARRAEAEVVRDSLLSVSGRIDLRLFGPSVHPYRLAADNEKRLFVGPLDGNGRRSIYIKYQLMEQPAFLRVFNLPGGKVTEGRRSSANTIEQNLAMLNDPLVLMLADKWAEELISDGRNSCEARLRAMFVKSIGREATQPELDRHIPVIQSFSKAHRISENAILSSRETWREVALTIFNLQEFLYIP